MKKAELLRRIEELERRVRDLESRPFVLPQPVIVPQGVPMPTWPAIPSPTWTEPWKPPFEVTC